MFIIEELEKLSISEDCFNSIINLIENYIDEAFDWKSKYRGKKTYSPEVQAKIDAKREQFKKLGKMIRDSRPSLNNEETKQVAQNAMNKNKEFQNLLKSAEDEPQKNIIKGNIKRNNNLIDKRDAKAINNNSQLQVDYENATKNAIDQFRTLGKQKLS